MAAEELTGGTYVVGFIMTVGGVVVVASLLALPAVRELRDQSKRWVPIVTAIAALVLPVVIGGQSLARYVDSLDDFTSAPDICESDVLTETRVAEFVPDPSAPDTESDSDDVYCTWKVSPSAEEDDGDAFELRVDLSKEDDSHAAADRLQRRQENKEGYGKTVTALRLGDEAIRHPSDRVIYSGYSVDALGTSVLVQVDNLVLEVEFLRSEALGTPDPAEIEALAAELARELESRQPDRWSRPVFSSS